MKKKYIYVQGHKWGVSFLPEPIYSDGVPVFGDANFNTHEIRIADKGLAESTVRATLLHELLHVILRAVANTASIQSEEGIVSCVEVGLFQLIMDKRNKWAMDYILNENK